MGIKIEEKKNKSNEHKKHKKLNFQILVLNYIYIFLQNKFVPKNKTKQKKKFKSTNIFISTDR